MTDPAETWRAAMAARAVKRAAAVAAGRSTTAQATRDAALCDLFLYLCVELREQVDQFTTLHPAERQDVHAAIAIAVRMAEVASAHAARPGATADDQATADALWSIARPARASMTLLRAAIAHQCATAGQPAPEWCAA